MCLEPSAQSLIGSILPDALNENLLEQIYQLIRPLSVQQARRVKKGQQIWQSSGWKNWLK